MAKKTITITYDNKGITMQLSGGKINTGELVGVLEMCKLMAFEGRKKEGEE